ncbi:Inner membrane protein YgaZ [uncultured Ruminococcus sp.]|uniref:Branched-chain amino acid ABC transporter permease n=1 Tax=Hydrogeniiclostridium mannosilyticum TaxID=2764322 RepID=A0A328UGP4_9FIRM|nr:AzlC family ABC transporter permease [Hydrogeniiclostridium mannosilyticum]RAQ22624.1 branched-chain amino acid ABC transporter permease [Hydrogeniiclostridium mannosilyticum]SCI50345.1 Inner membrane protein YgaZ [uncultured Ruminococcus sp.]
MQKAKRALAAAFPITIPVMVGYLFLGVAFGVLLQKNGYGVFWAILMSAVIYAGSMQFLAINFLTPGVGVLSIIFMTLMVNIRHIFYGLSMLERFRGTGKKKPYLIFSLTDETFSLLCSADPPQGVDRGLFYFFISLLDQVYWVAGSALGGLAGALLSFNTKGIDFAMTALFVVIFVNQWRESKQHLPALCGLGLTALCLLVFGADNFLLPALLLILAALLLCRRRLERGGDGA